MPQSINSIGRKTLLTCSGSLLFGGLVVLHPGLRRLASSSQSVDLGELPLSPFDRRELCEHGGLDED